MMPTGRGLEPRGGPPSGEVEESPATPVSPFARYAPGSAELAGAAEERRADSSQMVAIVTGLLFIMGASAVVLLGLILAGWFALQGQGGVAVRGPDDGPTHITDTDVAPDLVERRRSSGRPELVEAAPAGPTHLPATILIPKKILFHSIEVNCPSGIRERADFADRSATVTSLPVAEDCIVTFQGGRPAKAALSGGQTKACTFGPTRCILQ